MQRPAIREYVLNDVPVAVKELINSDVVLRDDAESLMFGYSKDVMVITILNNLTSLKI
jgi:hypothetical protein